MQNDEIKFKIEEIEKRISKTYKTGNNNNEEIEKRLVSLEASRTYADRQISTLCGNVDSLITVDSQYLDEFDLIKNRLDLLEENSGGETNSQVEENTTAISNLTTEVENLKSSNSEISQDIQSLQSTDEELSDKIDTLNSKIDSMGSDTNSDLPETYNFFNKEVFESNAQFYGLLQYFLTCFFICDPSSLCRIKVSAEVDLLHETETTVELNTFLNDEIINTQTYTAVGTESHSFEFEYDFYPTQINNNILFKSGAKNSVNKKARVVMKKYKVEIFGRNITILNKDLTYKFFICKDKYYITKNDTTGGYGKIMSVGATDWQENFTELPRLNYDPTNANATTPDKTIYSNYNYSFLPLITLDSTSNTYSISETDNTLIASLSGNRFCYVTNQSVVPTNFASLSYISPNDMYMASTPGEADTEVKNVCFVRYNNDYVLGMNNVKKSGLPAMLVLLNGESPPNKWVFNTPVMFKDWEDNPNNTYCCIGLDEFGHNYFFPVKNATYTVDLGVGTQTSAFKQTDGTINVYMSIANKIFKKVLKLNSQTSQYELISSEFFKDGNEYIEGYYDDYFIKKGRTWSYVPPTTNA